jgi:putative ABC transport system permease protein
MVNKNYFDFYGIELIEGTNFLENSTKEKHHIFNQSAIKSFNIENIDDAFITAYGNAKGNIIGIVEDFHFQKLDASISNLGFQLGEPEDFQYLFFKTEALSSSDVTALLSKVEKVWQEFIPDWPMEYGFQDQTLKELYEDEVRFSKIVILASIIALVIACIGLLGISIYSIEKRIKEIGVRKVNGAKIIELLALLNSSFAKYVFVSFIVSCPVSYLLVNKLFQNFAYKTELSWWIFAVAGLFTLSIALFTVSFQSYRAASKNPVEALRYE